MESPGAPLPRAVFRGEGPGLWGRRPCPAASVAPRPLTAPHVDSVQETAVTAARRRCAVTENQHAVASARQGLKGRSPSRHERLPVCPRPQERACRRSEPRARHREAPRPPRARDSRSLLLHFDDLDAAARALLRVRSELGLERIPHRLGADLRVPDVAGGREDAELRVGGRPDSRGPAPPPLLSSLLGLDFKAANAKGVWTQENREGTCQVTSWRLAGRPAVSCSILCLFFFLKIYLFI